MLPTTHEVLDGLDLIGQGAAVFVEPIDPHRARVAVTVRSGTALEETLFARGWRRQFAPMRHRPGAHDVTYWRFVRPDA